MLTLRSLQANCGKCGAGCKGANLLPASVFTSRISPLLSYFEILKISLEFWSTSKHSQGGGGTWRSIATMSFFNILGSRDSLTQFLKVISSFELLRCFFGAALRLPCSSFGTDIQCRSARLPPGCCRLPWKLWQVSGRRASVGLPGGCLLAGSRSCFWQV